MEPVGHCGTLMLRNSPKFKIHEEDETSEGNAKERWRVTMERLTFVALTCFATFVNLNNMKEEYQDRFNSISISRSVKIGALDLPPALFKTSKLCRLTGFTESS